jgi:chromosome segregation ATPase
MLPDNAPEKYKDRSTLWNAVEKSEKAKNAQTAREVLIGLPVELNRADQLDLLRSYIKNNFVDCGMCADICVHDKQDGNPHAHVMLTMRSIGDDGNFATVKSKKIYDLDADGNKQYDPVKRQYKCHKEDINSWNNHGNIEPWRERWAAKCNEIFELRGIPERLDHRSYERQGIEQIPTMHLGSIEHRLNKHGIKTERAKYNNEVKQTNQEYKTVKEQLSKEIETLKKDYNEYEKEKAAAEKRKSTAEEITKAINTLKLKYINLEYEKIVQEETKQKHQREIQNVKWRIDDLQRRQKTITSHNTDIDGLQAQREHLNIFQLKAKKQIDEDIADLQASKKTEIADLYSEYQIKPGQIDSYLKKLNERLNELLTKPITWAEYEKARDSRTASIEEQQAAIKSRYDQVMKILEHHPDGEKIKSALKKTNFETNSKDKQLFLR